ncbi:MAG: inositol monophosphatase family protein [Nanoarchaeota archaeon]
MNNYLDFAKELAVIAGERCNKDYGHVEISHLKNKESIVTTTDLACEKIIINAISKRFPDHSIYSEEYGILDHTSDYYWYIDPIDGTSNFTYHIPLWGVSIALFYKQRPLIGVVYMPVTKELMWAQQGEGAWCNNTTLRVSSATTFQGGLFLMPPYFYKMSAQVSHAILDLEKRGMKNRIIGAATANLHAIAAGNALIYIDITLKPYDYAAAALIVEEAGGVVTDHTGKAWWENITTEHMNLLATNKKLHQEALSLFTNLSPRS